MATDGYYRGRGRGLGVRLLPIGLAILAAAFVAWQGCQKGPFGRNQIVGVAGEQEKALGLQAYQEVLSKSDVLREGPVVDAVRKITGRLVDATRNPDFLRITQLQQPPKFDWEVRVV